MSKTAKKTTTHRDRSSSLEALPANKAEVFLSYNYADRRIAEQIAQRLAAAGYRIANGEDVVEPGENWFKVAGNALDRSDAIVFFLSPAALRSRSTSLELEFALGAKRLKHRVIPVLIDTDLGDVPWIIRHLPFVSMEKHETEDVGRVAKAVIKALDQRV
jgi:hypothetical protein